jgi:hypothetical protein
MTERVWTDEDESAWNKKEVQNSRAAIRLNQVARERLSKDGTAAVKSAMESLLGRYIDSRGGVEWDTTAATEPDYFVELEVVAEWLDYRNEHVAAWRQTRLQQDTTRVNENNAAD